MLQRRWCWPLQGSHRDEEGKARSAWWFIGTIGKFCAENQFPCNYQPDNSKRHSGFNSKWRPPEDESLIPHRNLPFPVRYLSYATACPHTPFSACKWMFRSRIPIKKNPNEGFKGILNSSLICSKGSLGEGSRETPTAGFCSLLGGHFCIGFITRGIRENGKWALWSVTLFSFTGIFGKGKWVLMYQVTSYLFVYLSLSCNNPSWCLRVRGSVGKLLKAPESLETICTEAHAHRFALLWPLAAIDGFYRSSRTAGKHCCCERWTTCSLFTDGVSSVPPSRAEKVASSTPHSMVEA